MMRNSMGLIVKLKSLATVAEVESASRTVKLKPPASVGVPLMVPVEWFSDSPRGSEPLAIDQP